MQVSNGQSIFLNAQTRGRIYLGSIGSGKTYIMCIAAMHEALKGRDTLIASFSYRNLKDVVLKTLKQVAELHGIPYSVNVGDMSLTINNRPILLRTANDPDRLRSYNLHSFFIEEAREVDDKAFEILLGRLRNSEDCFWGLVSTTRGKNWFYDIIKEEGLLDIFEDDIKYVANKNVTIVRSPIDDSPFLPQAYINELRRRYTTSFAQQELEGLIIDSAGEIISPDWFKRAVISAPTKGIRYWDLAVSTKASADFSSGCLMSRSSGKYNIHDIRKVKLAYPDLKKLIIELAKSDGRGVTIAIEEAGQQRAIIDDLRREPELAQYNMKAHRPTKDKVTRSYPFASQAELGNVLLNDGPWIRAFFDECNSFTAENVIKNKGHDDMIDSAVGAYSLMATNKPARMVTMPM